MSNEEEQQVEDVAADNESTHDEIDSETESDGEAQNEGSNEQSERKPETPEAKRARLKRQLEQLEKKHGFKDEESREEGGKETHSKEVTDERYDRLELKTEGVTSKKEQDAIIEYARFKKIDVVAALNSPAMKAELKEMRAKDATPSSSTRTGSGRTDDVTYWATQLTKYGKSAPTPELRAKVRTHLAGK